MVDPSITKEWLVKANEDLLLVNLLKTCSEHDPTLVSLKENCIILNAAYIETRYPVHWPTDYSKVTAEQSLAAVQAIAFEIQKRLA